MGGSTRAKVSSVWSTPNSESTQRWVCLHVSPFVISTSMHSFTDSAFFIAFRSFFDILNHPDVLQLPLHLTRLTLRPVLLRQQCSLQRC